MPIDTDKLTAKFQKTLSAQSLAEALGKTGRVQKLGKKSDRLRGLLEGEGVDLAGVEGTDFSEGLFSATEAQGLRVPTTQKKRDGEKRSARPSRFATQIQQLLAERKLEESQRIFDEDIDPQQQQIRDLLDERLKRPGIGAEELAAMRSSVSSNVKAAEESRLRRVSAVLGLRNIDPSSPAGAALANRVAEETDVNLVESLRKLGLDVSQINRSTELQTAQIAQGLLAQQVAARSAAVTGDFDRLNQVQSDIAGLFEAIRQSNETMELQKKLAGMERDTAIDTALIQGGANLLGSAASAAGGA